MIEDGANCLGYHYWGVIDNWSWINAFKNRYGFIRVCLDDGYKRKEKNQLHGLEKLLEQTNLNSHKVSTKCRHFYFVYKKSPLK